MSQSRRVEHTYVSVSAQPMDTKVNSLSLRSFHRKEEKHYLRLSSNQTLISHKSL